MPDKGRAFDKPGINYLHKAGSAKAAQTKAAVAASKRATELSKEIAGRIEASKISEERKQHALRAADEALSRLQNNVDPLSDLMPPPGCKVCAGNVKGTHHFLCRKRSLMPSGPERSLRSVVMSKLGAAWRELLYEESDASNPAVSAYSLRAPPLNPRSYAFARTPAPLNAHMYMYII